MSQRELRGTPRRPTRLPSVFLVAALIVPAPVRVGTIAFEHAVIRSDVIVAAEVTSVTEVPPPPGGWPTRHPGDTHALRPRRYATARVLEAWRGEPGATLRFLASSTWACDTSTAVHGERVVLFLQDRGGDVPQITHSGRGRMPVPSARAARAAVRPHRLAPPAPRR